MSKQCSGTNTLWLRSRPDMATMHQQASEPFQRFGGDTFQQTALQRAASDWSSNEVGDCQQPSLVLLQPAGVLALYPPPCSLWACHTLYTGCTD